MLSASRPLIALACCSLLACGKKPPPPPPATDSSCTGTAIADEGHTHVAEGTAVSYQHNPPASGSHWACWAPWRPAGSVLPPERWVHNLEHGGVVLLYQCKDATSCPAARDALVSIDDAAPDAPTGGHRIVVTADPSLPSAFAAVAWDFAYLSATADPGNFQCFIRAHEGHGPEDDADDPDPAVCPHSYQ